MAVEYDIVILGSSSAGIKAAIQAAKYKARVALVTFEKDFASTDAIDSRLFSEKTRQTKKYDLSVAQWSKEIIESFGAEFSPGVLAALGIDIITGRGEFARLPSLSFVANGRKLRSRSYLIALESEWKIPPILGLEEMGYLTPPQLWQRDALALPARLLIIGGSLIALELAQTLARLGKEVTLVIEDEVLLPAEDREASFLIQAQLEAEGIQILTQSAISQVRTIEASKWVQAGNYAIETDEIIVATSQKPPIEALNLEGVGIELSAAGVFLNEKLQTTHPKIYACGNVAGGYALSHIAEYEAQIALQNALFLPRYQVNYEGIPWVIFTHPSLARVGLTEVQARKRYGADILVLRQYYKHNAQALILDETTGFCKLIVHKNGEILGAHLVGVNAGEYIGEIALAVREKVKVEAIARFPHPFPTLSAIISQTASKYSFSLHSRTRWFNFRRNWTN